MILYGLKTCDTCRKAMAALRAAGKTVTLRDIREAPLSDAERAEFLAAFGERLANRSSTTWRGLTEAERALPLADCLARHPALMRRPVIRARDGTLHLGWDAAVQAALAL